MKEPNIIIGGSHIDERGKLTFFNQFDMSAVKRFYSINHPDINIIRGWRAHKIEQRWFRVCKGAFKISLVKIDNWQQPDAMANLIHFELDELADTILHVPAGYATCLQAKVVDSVVLVFGDYDIAHAQADDYLYPNDYFKNV